MKLLQVAKLEWCVLAVCDHRGKCQVSDFLKHGEKNLTKKMNALLEQRVANYGPDLHNNDMVKHLDRGIYEFKRGPRTGAKIRVVFFRDDGQKRVICTEALTKRDENLAPFIKTAKKIQLQYTQALNNCEIRIIQKQEYGHG